MEVGHLLVEWRVIPDNQLSRIPVGWGDTIGRRALKRLLDPPTIFRWRGVADNNNITSCTRTISIVSVSEPDLFGKPSVQTRIENTTVKNQSPISNIIDSGPLELTITESGDEYLYLTSAYLHLTASISDGEVTNPTGDYTDYTAVPVNEVI